MLERLHKLLARAGVAALRPAEDMILAGRVTVNGRVVREVGARADPDTDIIAVDGAPVDVPAPSDPRRYVLLHKPAGVISTAHDTHERPTVLGLVPSDARLFPVGRLDADSEGLILLTDDGDLAYRLTHPRFSVSKEYRVLVDRSPTVEQLRQWRAGVKLADDFMTSSAWCEILERTMDGAWLRVVMNEGHKRQIREVARALGLNVRRLIRVREGSLALGDLPPGASRPLTQAEIEALRAETQHVPSREADQQREDRMADEEQDRSRRLRVIKRPRGRFGGPPAADESRTEDTPPEQARFDAAEQPEPGNRRDDPLYAPRQDRSGGGRSRDSGGPRTIRDFGGRGQQGRPAPQGRGFGSRDESRSGPARRGTGGRDAGRPAPTGRGVGRPGAPSRAPGGPRGGGYGRDGAGARGPGRPQGRDSFRDGGEQRGQRGGSSGGRQGYGGPSNRYGQGFGKGYTGGGTRGPTGGGASRGFGQRSNPGPRRDEGEVNGNVRDNRDPRGADTPPRGPRQFTDRPPRTGRPGATGGYSRSGPPRGDEGGRAPGPRFGEPSRGGQGRPPVRGFGSGQQRSGPGGGQGSGQRSFGPSRGPSRGTGAPDGRGRGGPPTDRTSRPPRRQGGPPRKEDEE